MIHRSIKRGFTILELIVAMSVTVLMLVMISALFTATSDGVSLGMAVSDVIGAGRAVGDQIQRDAQEMLEPHNNGVLVIVCQKQTDVLYRDRRQEKTRAVRSDQIMWIRRMGNSSNGFGAGPITPLDNSTFSSATKTQMGATNAIRIWYGHGLKTNPAGTSAPAHNVAGSPNRQANEWPLVRHALFLRGDPTAPTFNHSQGAHSTATVSSHVTKPGGGGGQLYHGLTDVAHLSHAGDPAAGGGSLVSNAQTAGGVYSNMLWFGASKSEYDNRAINHMFLDSNRMWINPFPQPDPQDANSWVTSGQVAQMHPLLMDRISDFIVEFAADAVNTTSVNPKEPDGFDGGPDVDAAGETIWYGLENVPATNSQGPPAWDPRVGLNPNLLSPVVTGIPGGGVAYVFRHGVGEHRIWPYMIRIRYRIHDTRGDLLGDQSLQPGDTSNVGRWFEQIIKVNRN